MGRVNFNGIIISWQSIAVLRKKKLWGCPLNGLCITFNAPKSWSLSLSFLFVYRQTSFSLFFLVLGWNRVKHCHLLLNSLIRRGKKSLIPFHLRKVMILLILIQNRESKQEFWWAFLSLSRLSNACAMVKNLAFVVVNLLWVEWYR